MDGERFDRLTRAMSASASRRRLATGLLAGAGAGLVALVGGRPGARPALAADDNRCLADKQAISDQVCSEETICRSTRDQLCACARTLSGDRRCVDLTNPDCPTTDECDGDDDCRGEHVCIKIGGCCGGRKRNACVRPCDSRSGASAAGAAGFGAIATRLRGR